DGSVSIIDQMLPCKAKWQLSIFAMQAPASGKIKLVDFGVVPEIEYSDRAGAIKIVKPSNTLFTAWQNARHPDFPFNYEKFSGSVTAEGDVIIPAPAGFYRLEQPGKIMATMQAQMVPVHPGKLTIIENWPSQPRADHDKQSNEGENENDDSVVQEKEMLIRSFKLLENDQVQLRFATPEWSGVIAKEELEAFEGGVRSEIISARATSTPLNLTILLDSSGSMRKDMKLALQSVDKFIQQLPKDAEITLVDFDTKPKVVKAKDRNTLVKALKQIKADGATCLNDSVMLGLSNSSQKSRPAVVLFTDGFDANYNDTKPGSKTTPEEMFAAVKQSAVPVFTIGFGATPDNVTLKRLATLSGGFYSKADSENIETVFSRLASVLGREHEMVYQRPGVKGNSDAPVVSIVLDVSGSMNLPPTEESCDYRLEKAKAILRNFIKALPDNAIAQITTYQNFQDVVQVFTGDKQQLLASLAGIKAGGGTETANTLAKSFRMLNAIPTDRRYLLFITDAGLDIEEKKIDYESILGSIKDAGIQTTWIGMVEEEDKAPFDLAAKLCGGSAIVSTDLNAIGDAIRSFGRSINENDAPADPKTPVSLSFSRRFADGKMLSMNDIKRFELPAPPVVATASVNGLKIKHIDLPITLQRYSYELSTLLYGASRTRDETIVNDRIPLNVSGSNKAIKLTVIEMLLMSKFRGFDQKCAAVKFRFENILPEQEVFVMSGADAHPASFVGMSAKPARTIKAIPPYSIPATRNHFFARINELNPSPVSDLSWLVEEALIEPDDESIVVRPGEPVEGYLIFDYVGDDSVAKASISFFDTVYGHIMLPVIGTMQLEQKADEISKLPKEVEGKVTDSFKLLLTGFVDKTLPDQLQHLTLRTFNLQMISQIQAYLDLDPTERLSLMLPTRFGNLFLSPSPRTAALPMGWHRPVLFLPGSHNHLRQAYVMPTELAAKTKGTLRLDAADNNLYLNAGDHELKRDEPILSGQGDKIKLDLNGIGFDGDYALLDITLHDEKDGSGTGISTDNLLKIHDGEYDHQPYSDRQEYLFQVVKRVVVADGHSRRFLVKVYCPTYDDKKPVLLSELFNINYPIQKLERETLDSYMRCRVDEFKFDIYRQEQILALAQSIVADRRSRGVEKPGSARAIKQNISGKEIDDGIEGLEPESDLLLPPRFNSAFAEYYERLMQMNEKAFFAEMKKLRCVPVNKFWQHPAYAPEAVLMQGWGTLSDLYAFGRLYYEKNGFILAEGIQVIKLDDQGKAALKALTGWETDIDFLPVLSVGDQKIVVPFFEEIGNLSAINGELESGSNYLSGQLFARISVSLKVRRKAEGITAMMGAMSSGLGGGDGEGEIEIIKILELSSMSLAECSAAPIDVFYFSPDNGQSLYAYAEGINGVIKSSYPPLRLAEYEVLEERIEIIDGVDTHLFTRSIEEDRSIVDTFRSIAIGLPDITASGSKLLANTFTAQRSNEAPGTRSTVRWFTHSRIYEFLALQTAAERKAAEKTGVKVARPGSRMRVILLTVSGENKNI
ncbi:MAG: VWA domain-containing protein, partial [Candidatus Riflebacteria bacterium]|nr:VWA domain-containing protein [Candidatus Riflebacteria bacterium]